MIINYFSSLLRCICLVRRRLLLRLLTLTLTTARTRQCRWEKLPVWSVRFIMWRTGSANIITNSCLLAQYLLLCQVCVLGPAERWSHSHRGRGSVHL